MTANARPDFATDDDVERVLVVTAHPDDVDFGVAGSVAAWTAAGIDVTYCLVTDGEAGGDDRAMPRSEMAKIRQAEQRVAAGCVGVGDLRFLGYPDGRLEAGQGLRHDLSRVIRQVRPQGGRGGWHRYGPTAGRATGSRLAAAVPGGWPARG